MKVNVGQNVLGPDGEFIMKGNEDRWKLGGIFSTALGGAPVKDKSLNANYERSDLAAKIAKGGDVEFSISEAKMIQDCLIGSFGPFVVAAAARLLEECCGPDEEEVVTRKPPKKKGKKK